MFAMSVAWQMTLGLVGVFFVFFPLVVNVMIGFIAAQVMGERRANTEYEREHSAY
jgi:hypothetical protein